MINFISVFLLFHILNSQQQCPFDQKCAYCAGNKCLLCYDSYPDSQGLYQIPAQKIDNCLQYQNKQNCSACQFGYGVQEGKCKEIKIDNCAQVDQNGNCVMCKKNILIDLNGRCQPKNQCETLNCNYCAKDKNKNEFCMRCQGAYALQKQGQQQKCIEEKATLFQQNCYFLANDGTCLICDLNYYQSTDGKCLQTDKKLEDDSGNDQNNQGTQQDVYIVQQDIKQKEDKKKEAKNSFIVCIFVNIYFLLF